MSRLVSSVTATVQLEIVDQIHYMGGSIRKEFTKNVTHFMSKTVQSEEYHVSLSFRLVSVSSTDQLSRRNDSVETRRLKIGLDL